MKYALYIVCKLKKKIIASHNKIKTKMKVKNLLLAGFLDSKIFFIKKEENK